MIYRNLLTPAQLKKVFRQRLFVTHWSPQYQYTYILHTAETAILRTNRNINREACAVLYRNILLVSIDWNTDDRKYIRLFKMSRDAAFNYLPPGAPLPPCVVRVQHQYHGRTGGNAVTSTVVAAVDFPLLCQQLLMPERISLDHMCEARTSYSIVSLPNIGYNTDRVRELIWLPLRSLGEGRLADDGEITHRNLRPIDCTGVFEEKAAMLDWKRKSDDETNKDRERHSEQNDSDDHGRSTDTSGQEDSDEGDSDEKDSEEEDSDDTDVDEDGHNDEANGKNGDEEDRGEGATSNEHCSHDPREEMSRCVASRPGHDGDANAKTIVEDNSVAGGRTDHDSGHALSGYKNSNADVDDIMNIRDVEGH